MTYKLRVACSGLIYRKSLSLSKSSSDDDQNGKIINLLSNDLEHIDLYVLFGLWKGPIETVLFLVIIYTEIGVAGIIGMAFLLAFVPVQGSI